MLKGNLIAARTTCKAVCNGSYMDLVHKELAGEVWSVSAGSSVGIYCMCNTGVVDVCVRACVYTCSNARARVCVCVCMCASAHIDMFFSHLCT